MPKMQLDQKQPAKVSKKKMAQRKKAKMMKEQAKLEELRRQFPKLFSPEKVKNIQDRNKSLVQSSLKEEVCPVVDENIDNFQSSKENNCNENDQENVPESIRNRKPFSSPPVSSPMKKGLSKQNPPSSNSERVLQVLASPSPAVSSQQDLRVSIIPGCSCKRTRSDSDLIDDVENQHCDICDQIAPLANTSHDVVDALRNFIHKPPAQILSTDGQTSEEGAVKEEIIEIKQSADDIVVAPEKDITPVIVDPMKETTPVTNLFEDLNMEMPESEAVTEMENPEVSDVPQEASTNNDLKYCFDETILAALLDDRFRGRIVGRKVLDDHVEYIYKIQVLKEGLSFQDINDVDYLADCMSPSSLVTTKDGSQHSSPYIIQMCILRRYSDFEKLQESLVLSCKKANFDISKLHTAFPEKQFFRFFGKRWADPSFLKGREECLTLWMGEVVLPTLKKLSRSTSSKRIELRDKVAKTIHEFIAA